MKLQRTNRILTPLLLAVSALGAPLVAQETENAPRPALAEYNLEKGLALEGYDPVAYFPEGGGEPTEGRKDLTATHRGVTYRFASEANRERFLAGPERFEPAYGGWCAYAMAGGDQVDVDTESFLIEGGRLLVFYKGFFNNTRKKWLEEGSDKLRPRADAGWRKISGEGSGRDVSHFNLDDGLALQGYDPAAYERGASKKGKEALSTVFGGVEYRFASEESKEAFLADPRSNEPHYGGWCAWAMAQGKKVQIDPDAFVRDAEGLFVFYDEDKRDEWVAAREQMKAAGDEHWARITTEG
jgi:YHS domain-containing protein